MGHAVQHTALVQIEQHRRYLSPRADHQDVLEIQIGVHQAAPAGFLARVRERAHSLGRDEVELLGPAPAPMERRAGRFRAQLLFLAHRRAHLHQLLGALAPELDRIAGSGVRWSLDVDPSEEF